MNMRKILLTKLTAMFLILGIAATDVSAQTRIRFARGTDSATITGTLAAGAKKVFLLRVASGQVVTINVDGGNGKILIGGSDVHGAFDSAYDELEFTSDDNGDQRITLTNKGRGRTSFAMTVAAR